MSHRFHVDKHLNLSSRILPRDIQERSLSERGRFYIKEADDEGADDEVYFQDSKA